MLVLGPSMEVEMLWRTVGSVPSLIHIFSALLKLNLGNFFFLFQALSVPHFIINEAVLTGLEVLIQAIFDIDYILVLRGPLAVILTAA